MTFRAKVAPDLAEKLVRGSRVAVGLVKWGGQLGQPAEPIISRALLLEVEPGPDAPGPLGRSMSVTIAVNDDEAARMATAEPRGAYRVQLAED